MRFRWLDCELDREARTLVRGQTPARAQPLVVDLLLLLLAQRGRVVSEERLRRELWPGVQVTDASLRRLLKETRRTIGDDGARQEQIQTVRGRGIRFAAEVTTEDGWDTAFVGRPEVLEALDQKLEEVASGIGGVSLLHGPAGIGKTRTLVEIEARADARGFQVLRGCGRFDAEGDAFHPWLEAFEGLDLAAPLRAEPGDAAGHSRRPSTADARRFATFRTVVQKLTQLARRKPLLILLDDLQVADPDSIALLRFVAPSLAQLRVWILAAYRTATVSAASQVQELAALGADSSTQDIALRGLDGDELGRLIEGQLHARVGSRLAAIVAERTDGNPLHALEVARSLLRDGESLEAGPTPEVSRKLVRGIQPLLARRLVALPKVAQRLLRAAAALGLWFDAEVLQSAESCSKRQLTQALAAAENAGLVASVAGRWQFAHPLFAEALYAELAASSDDAAASQHLRIAETLERRGSPKSFEIANHFLRARPRVSAERVLPYARTAARDAFQRSAFADAEYWYREAVELAESAGAEPSEICELLLGLGDVLVSGVGVSRARLPFERVARLAQETGDRRNLGLAALGFAHRPSGMGTANAEVLHWLEAANASPCGDPAVDAPVASRLGAELAGSSPEQRARSEALLSSSRETALAFGDPFTIGRVLGDRSSSGFSARDPSGWIALADEIIRHARAAGDLETEFRGLEARATGILQLGDRGALEDAVQRCRRFSSDHPFRFARTVSGGMDAMLALLDGRFADARVAIDQAESDSGGAASLGLAAQISTQRFWLALEEGRLEGLPQALERAFARFPGLPALMSGLGLAHALSGDRESARRTLAAVLAGVPTMPYDRGRLPCLVIAAEIAYRVRARDAATVLEPELSPYAELGSVVATASIYTGSVSHGLGWLAALRGEVGAATEHFNAALRMHERLRSPVWQERTRAALAEISRPKPFSVLTGAKSGS